MFKKSVILLFIILCASFIFSCKEDGTCREERYVRMYAFFKRLNISDAGDTTTVKLRIDTLSINGLGIDSMLYNRAVGKESVHLPLNKFSNMSQFIFNVNDTIDTISIYHTNTEKYLSFECGVSVTFKIDSIKATDYYIDSILLNIDTVDIRNAEHIYIYHTPR